MNKIEPGIGISRRYLHDEVADRMRELIRSGEMEPKARINESELTERFGSRGPRSARRSRSWRRKGCSNCFRTAGRGSPASRRPSSRK